MISQSPRTFSSKPAKALPLCTLGHSLGFGHWAWSSHSPHPWLDQTMTHAHLCLVFKRVIASCALLACLHGAFAAQPERSVIQISTFSQEPSWDAPWRF